jgi:hypothetical protein
MGDIAYYDYGVRKSDQELVGKKFDHLNPEHYTVVPKLNKLGKIPNKTSWDSFAYALMMGHNVECHIRAVQRSNNLMDIEYAKHRPDWRRWRKVKDADKSDEMSEWVPRNILYFNRFVEELFNSKTKDEAFEMITEAERLGFLQNLEGARLRGGVTNIANTLFYEEEEDETSWQDDREDESLDNLKVE